MWCVVRVICWWGVLCFVWYVGVGWGGCCVGCVVGFDDCGLFSGIWDWLNVVGDYFYC